MMCACQVAACSEFNVWIKEQRAILSGDLCSEVLPVEEVEPAAEVAAHAGDWCLEHAWHLQASDIGADNAVWVAGDATVADCEEQRARVVEAMGTVLMLIKLYEEDYERYKQDEEGEEAAPVEVGEDLAVVARRAALEIIGILEEHAGMKLGATAHNMDDKPTRWA